MRYLPALDGLRGAAVLLVLYCHSAGLKPIGAFLGVDIFFVLSGFLITSILVTEWEKYGNISLSRFYLRRIFRLFPALVVVLLFVIAFKNPVLDSLITFFYLSNWVRAFEIRSLGLLEHTWSLAIEEQFYLLWPPTLFFLLKYIRSKIGITLFVTVLIGLSAGVRAYLVSNESPMMRFYNGLDSRSDGLLAGCLLGYLYALGSIPKTTFLKFFYGVASFASIAGLTLLVIRFDFNNRSFNGLPYFAVAVFSFFMILDLVMNEKGAMNKFLSLPPFVWIGKISYGLYLWHYPIFLLVRWNGDKPAVQQQMIGWTATFALAVFSFYVVEQPFLRMKQRLKTSTIS